MIIDTHAHLDVKKFNSDLHAVIDRAKNNGVGKFIIPAIESDNMRKIIQLAEQYENIYFSSGNHPNRPESFCIESIRKYASHAKCVAIGECGLDWYRIPKGANIEEIKAWQKNAFTQQIKLSKELNKPLILHSRETDDDMMEVLMQNKADLVGGVVHCYIGSEKLLKLKEFNFYFGIGGVITYKSATELRENIKKVPLDRILIETDAPYLTPLPYRGKRNEPSYTVYILQELSVILNISVEKLEKQIEENTKRLFGI